MKNWKRYIPFAVITLLFAVVYYNCFDSKLDLNGDNAAYIRLARNLANGLGYSNISPEGVTPASHFPPGYPAFLSLFVSVGLDNLILFKILNGVLLLLSVCMLYVLSYRLSGNRPLAITASVLVCFSPHLMHFASMAMSEMLYLTFTVLAFVALYRYVVRAPSPFYKSLWFYIAILSAVASYYVRTVGASIIFAVLIFFLFRKEWKPAVASLLGMIMLLVPWMLRNSIHGIESRYFGTIMTVNPWRPELGTVSGVGEMLSKMITNIDETVIKGFREILFPFLEINYQEPSGIVGVIAGLSVACIVLYGCWSGGRNFRFPFLAFILANIGLFALWHGGNGSRYVVPIAPYLFLFFYLGLYNIVLMLLQKVLKLSVNIGKKEWLPYLFLFVALPMITSVKNQSMMASQPFPPAYSNYFKLAETMQKQLPAGSVVSCRKPELFDYFAPSHYASRYPFTNDSKKMLSGLLERKVDFVILEQLGYSSTVLYLLPVVQEHPDMFRVAAHLPNPDTYLLYFDKEKAKEFLQK